MIPALKMTARAVLAAVLPRAEAALVALAAVVVIVAWVAWLAVNGWMVPS